MFTCLLLSWQTGVNPHHSRRQVSKMESPGSRNVIEASQPLLEGSGRCAVYESRFASYGDSRATDAEDRFVYADE